VEFLILLLVIFCGILIADVVEKAATINPLCCRSDPASNIMLTAEEVRRCVERNITNKMYIVDISFVVKSLAFDIDAVNRVNGIINLQEIEKGKSMHEALLF
jgi:hypothetical protein